MLKSRETDTPTLQQGATGRANDLLKIPVALTLNPTCYSRQSCGLIQQGGQELDGKADKQMQQQTQSALFSLKSTFI